MSGEMNMLLQSKTIQAGCKFTSMSMCMLKSPSNIKLGESEERWVVKAANSFIKSLLCFGGR